LQISGPETTKDPAFTRCPRREADEDGVYGLLQQSLAMNRSNQ
jgi:hypothetical protein